MEDKNFRLTIVILVAMLTILIALMISVTFRLETIGNLVMSWILTSIFSLFTILMVEPKIISGVQVQVDRPVYIDRPVEVIREVPVAIQIPVENKTIEVVDREVPVIKKVIQYVEKPRQKLNIPKFKFLASTQTKTFHSRNCRLGKLIKKKNKVHSNSKNFFKKKHYKGCKACIKRK